jgi:hypothetical protein
MSVREQLHELIDQLDEDDASDALSLLRRAYGVSIPPPQSAEERLAQRYRPLAVPAERFFNEPPKDLARIAEEQGVKPVERFEDLLGDFWPEDESIDDFVATIRQWRREGGYA